MNPAAASTPTAITDKPRTGSKGWATAIVVILLCPLWFPLMLVAVLLMAVVGLPIVVVNSLILEPRLLRKHVYNRGRILGESECIARLRRAEGTLLIEDRGGGLNRAWWTPDAIPPLAADVSQIDEDQDTDEDEMSAELWTAVEQTKQLMAKYTDVEHGSALLVRKRKGEQLAEMVRRAIGSDRVVTIRIWVEDMERDPTVCWNCDYDLRGLESGVCPECGTKVGWSKRDSEATIAAEAESARTAA